MDCGCIADTNAEQIYCCEAWPAWEAGRWPAAADAAGRAFAADPALDAAALLHAMAVVRFDRAEGLLLLAEVGKDAADPEVRERAGEDWEAFFAKEEVGQLETGVRPSTWGAPVERPTRKPTETLPLPETELMRQKRVALLALAFTGLFGVAWPLALALAP